jgi:thiol-disulfide isomerase/thioredoxin
MTRLTLLGFTLALFVSSNADARRGIQGQKAPALDVSHWFNLPQGTDRVDVGDLRGKVVYLYFFQSWCPGCHKRGFPTLATLSKRFKGDKDVAFVAIQTVFEGYDTNTVRKAKTTADRYGLTCPVGHDGGEDGKRSSLMRRYRSGGTPWVVVIDKLGVVRFNSFHIDPKKGERLIRTLKAQ